MTTITRAGSARVVRKDLLAAVRALRTFVYKQDPYIHIGTDDGLYIEAGSSEESGRYFLEAEHEGDFDAVVTLVSLTNAVKGCRDREIAITGSRGQVTLTAGGVRHALELAEYDGFLGCHYDANDQIAHFGPSAIARLIEATSAAAPDESRPILTGVNITHDNDGITRAVSTDSFRLIVKELASTRVTPGIDVNIPAKRLAAILKSVQKGQGVLLHAVGATHVVVDTGIAQFSLRRIEGQFITWRQLIPEYQERVRVDREEFLAAAKDASTLLGANQPIRLEFSESELGVRAMGTAGEAHALVTVTSATKFADLTMGINHEFLRSALSNLTGDTVTLEFASVDPANVRRDPAIRPLLITDELGDFTLNMPVRLGS